MNTVKMSMIYLILITLCATTHANPNLLEELRSPEKHIIRLESVRDLFLMEDDAIPFLIQTLSDENQNARHRAGYLLENYFGDPSTLSALSVIFLHETNGKIRYIAARAIANIDYEYAKNFLAKHLNADSDTQAIVIDVLSNLKDERVIPKLVERLEASDTRENAAFALADFKDKRAIPTLIEMLNDPDIQRWNLEIVVQKLGHINDDHANTGLLKLLDPNSPSVKKSGKFFYTNQFAKKISKALSQSEPAIVPALLKMLEHYESSDVQQWALRTIGGLRNPKLVPIIEKTYLKTDSSELRSVLIEALENMGIEGLKSLLSIMQQKPDAGVLVALATYNSEDAIDAVAAFALNRSSELSYNTEDSENSVFTSDRLPPLRENAIKTLIDFGDLGKGKISKHIPQLLADPDPRVKLLTLDLIRKMQLIEFVPALKPLTQDVDKNIREAAQIVSDILSGKPLLKLNAESDKPQYDYGQPISLNYSIKNVSNHSIKIGFSTVSFVMKPEILNNDGTSAGFDIIDLDFSGDDNICAIFRLGTIKLEILNPDGTSAGYNFDHSVFDGNTQKEITLNPSEVLNPGDIFTNTISISDGSYWLHQTGRYTVILRINLMSEYYWSVKPYEIFSKVHIDIAPPAKDEVDALLSSIDTGDYNDAIAVKIYHQIYELNKSGLFPDLKKHSLIPLEETYPYSSEMDTTKRVARWLGPHFLGLSYDELVNKCIEMLPDKKVAMILGKLGNKRALKSLRSFALNGTPAAAVALQELGDHQTTEWCKKLATRKLRHWKKEERVNGAMMHRALMHFLHYKEWDWTNQALKSYGFYDKNDSPILASNWAEIVEKAKTFEGLKALLKHPIFAVRLGSAYELAYLGVDILTELKHR